MEAKLRSLPPLVTSWEVERLKGYLAEAQEGGSVKYELRILIRRLGEIEDELGEGGVPTLEELDAVERDVLPYCFLGDISQRAGQDISEVQLELAAKVWEEDDADLGHEAETD